MLNSIEGIMNLAAASGEDLASTSDIVTDAMTAFGLAAERNNNHHQKRVLEGSFQCYTFCRRVGKGSIQFQYQRRNDGETFKYVAP